MRRVTFDHLADAKRVIAWVHEHGHEYGADPSTLIVTGGSAGAHLSMVAAQSQNEPDLQPGFEEADTSVVAAVPIYGVYDWTNRDGTGRADMGPMVGKLVFKKRIEDAPEVWDHASPMSWVGPDAPPMFMLHGTNDTLVPVEQARAFVSMLRAESKNTVAYAELPGAQHAFELFDSPRSFAATAAVTRFLDAIRAREGHTVDV